MKKLYQLWDSKLRTGVLVLFGGFLLLLIFQYYEQQITYHENKMKLHIQDSVVFQLDNGMTLTIYKHEDSTNNNIVTDSTSQ